MAFSANSSISVCFGPVLINFSFHMGHIFLLLFILENFSFDAKHCEFYFAGYFCISINCLELCSGIESSYVENA